MADQIWDLHCHLSGVPGRTPLERAEQLHLCRPSRDRTALPVTWG